MLHKGPNREEAEQECNRILKKRKIFTNKRKAAFEIELCEKNSKKSKKENAPITIDFKRKCNFNDTIEISSKKPKKIIHDPLISKKRKFSSTDGVPEKVFIDPQLLLNELIANVFKNYIDIDNAQALLDFFKTHCFSKLNFNTIINGSSIFTHIMTAAKSNGTLAPFVINKLCDEGLLGTLDWNITGNHCLSKEKTPLWILCEGLHDKQLRNKLVSSLFEQVPERALDLNTQRRINHKWVSPFSILNAVMAKIAQDDEAKALECISSFQKMKI